MSFEREVNSSVKTIVESIKSTVVENIIFAVRKGAISLDESKLPGLRKIIIDSTDQAFSNSSNGLSQVLEKHARESKKRE